MSQTALPDPPPGRFATARPGDDRWPFVGRSSQVSTCVAALTGDPARSLLLVGQTGIGKTRLAAATAAAVAAEGWAPIHLRCTHAATGVPFGPLAPLLASLGVTPTSDLDEGVGLLAAVTNRAAERADLILVVDDLHRADPGTLAAIDALLHTATPIIATARSGDAWPEALEQWRDDGQLTPVEVGPLTAEDVRAALDLALSAPATSEASARLHDASGGNPLFLRELVRATDAAGGFETTPEGLAITELTTGDRLRDLIRRHLDGLRASDVALLEVVAAGQPLPAGQVDPVTLANLVSEGLVTVDGTDRVEVAQLRLSHPLYDEVIRAIVPGERWRERLIEAAGILEDGPGPTLRAVALKVEADAAVSGEDLVAAPEQALRIDPGLAVDLAERATAKLTGEAATRSSIIHGRALARLGDIGAATAELRQALLDAATDPARVAAAKALGEIEALRGGRPAQAVEMLEATTARTTDPAARALLRADQVRWAMLAGLDLPPGPDAPPDDGIERLNVVMTEALVSLMGGSLSTANRCIDDGLAMVDRMGADPLEAKPLLMLSRFMAAFFAGRPAEAREIAEGAARGADEAAAGVWAYALAALDLHGGRARAAEHHAREAEAYLSRHVVTGLAATATAVRATAVAQLGDAFQARSILEESDPPDTDIWAALQRVQAELWLLPVTTRHAGPDPDALALIAPRLEATWRRGVDSGHLYLTAFSAYNAVRIGAAEAVADLLTELAERGEGELLPAMAAHAGALAHDDGAALEAVADRLAVVGLRTAAADALEQAAAHLRRQGASESARRLHLRAAHVVQGFDGGRWPASAGTDPGDRLTPREAEVAGLAASRWRSREIAARLEVSVRTVDNHLARAFRKLDISSRDELSPALRAIGLPASDELPPENRHSR